MTTPSQWVPTPAQMYDNQSVDTCIVRSINIKISP